MDGINQATRYIRAIDVHITDWITSIPHPVSDTANSDEKYWSAMRALEVGLRLWRVWPSVFYS